MSTSYSTRAAVVTGASCGPRLAIVQTTRMVQIGKITENTRIQRWVDNDFRDMALDKLGRDPERIHRSKIQNWADFEGASNAAAPPPLTGLYKTTEGALRIETTAPAPSPERISR